VGGGWGKGANEPSQVLLFIAHSHSDANKLLKGNGNGSQTKPTHTHVAPPHHPLRHPNS